MTPTTYGRDFAYCLKSHGGVRGFNASLWRFLLRCTLFCHSVATFLTSVSSYEGGCGFEDINISKPEEELLEIMETRSHITAGQLHNLEEDEECLQACSDLAEIVIEMQKEQNLLAIDVRKELADFRNKHSKND